MVSLPLAKLGWNGRLSPSPSGRLNIQGSWPLANVVCTVDPSNAMLFCFVCRMLQNICNYVICSTEVDFHQCLRRASLIWLLIIIQHLYLSGVWLLVDLKGTPKYMCFKEIGL